MCFLVATFDHAHPGSQGTYWAYAHPDLETAVLNKLYFEVVAPALRSHTDWAGLLEMAGFATLGPRWACWFKRFDVGADLKGRPGRFVIACAFVERSEIAGRDRSGVFTSPHFAEVAQIARKHCPLPAPSVLTIEIECGPARPVEQLLAQLHEKRSCDWRGPEALMQLGSLATLIPQSQELRAFVVEVSGQTAVYADLLTGSSPKPIAVAVQNHPLAKKDAKLPHISPPTLLRSQSPTNAQSSKFLFFVMGLIVGLGFGVWFGRTSATRSRSATDPGLSPPSQNRASDPAAKGTARESTNSNSSTKKPPASPNKRSE